ncbi:DUF2889 domain-containing protein [Caballeronia sp. LZ035]|uniref:DUF2889 domain-containing protein n=1 Tax=Caballeronia sp. LZ035 TaxID=3038568 RepID=UPI002861FF82|nr:DUF2889 domain-containing protein [Caballeronia sp. LZ035]MDR5756086.1 DUF2889 domain-containing protein [Caballeronia sp. LZ035]
MPLSPPVSRHLRHRRAIRLEAFEREDGLWDIEACLTDEKPRDFKLATGVRPLGLPIHELWLRITIDRNCTIVGAEASSDWSPYGELCAESNTAYRKLIGLNLLQNFRREANQALRGTAGCTHLTELCGVLPTAAVQAFAGDVWKIENGNPFKRSDASHADRATPEEPPFQLGRCHALRFDGPAVKEHYPRWFGYTPAEKEPTVTTQEASAHTSERADPKDRRET